MGYLILKYTFLIFPSSHLQSSIFNLPSFDNLMFGLIGHLTSLEHAQSVANELGYPEYGDQGLDFWCSAPPQIVDHITVCLLYTSPSPRD